MNFLLKLAVKLDGHDDFYFINVDGEKSFYDGLAKLGFENFEGDIDYQILNFSFDGGANYLIKKEMDISDLLSIIEQLNQFDTWEELYDSLHDTSDVQERGGTTDVWYDFDEATIDSLFPSPYEAMKAGYFGKIHNWQDNYFKINAYGNIETADEPTKLDFKDRDVRLAIFEQFVDENY